MRTLSVLFAILCTVPVINGQEKKESAVHGGRNIEQFAYPFKDFTYISPRYDRTTYDNNGFSESYYIRTVYTAKGRDHFRLDLPLGRSNMTDDGKVDFGLSDISLRFTQYAFELRHWFFGYALKAVFPTATFDALGAGKWQLHPGIGGNYFFGENDDKGSFLFAMEYRFSVAGDKNRDDVSMLAIIPNIDIWMPRWYLGYYATWSYNFITDYFDLPLDVEFGYFLTQRFVVAAEMILPLLKEAPYRNEFSIKLRYAF